MMMALGTFVFSLPTLVYQELQRKTSWKHVETERLGVRAANQFLGPGADTISLPGVLVPDVAGDPFAISDLREMGDQGEPWSLVSGTGEVMGAWVITDLDETQSIFFEDGVARKTDFTLSLKQVDEPIALGAAAPAAAT
jgi:phage protein U